jgi:hypothetical protein
VVPVAGDAGEAVLGEVGGRGLDETVDEIIAFGLAAEADEGVLGGDDEGRIADDEEATGSKRLPWRRSTLSMALASMPQRAKVRARGLTSVAMMRPQWPAATMAWKPWPVPRSSMREAS